MNGRRAPTRAARLGKAAFGGQPRAAVVEPGRGGDADGAQIAEAGKMPAQPGRHAVERSAQLRIAGLPVASVFALGGQDAGAVLNDGRAMRKAQPGPQRRDLGGGLR
jgi:hypothetical protein